MKTQAKLNKLFSLLKKQTDNYEMPHPLNSDHTECNPSGRPIRNANFVLHTH